MQRRQLVYPEEGELFNVIQCWRILTDNSRSIWFVVRSVRYIGVNGRVVAGTVGNSVTWLKLGRVIASTRQSLTRVTSHCDPYWFTFEGLWRPENMTTSHCDPIGVTHSEREVSYQSCFVIKLTNDVIGSRAYVLTEKMITLITQVQSRILPQFDSCTRVLFFWNIFKIGLAQNTRIGRILFSLPQLFEGESKKTKIVWLKWRIDENDEHTIS